ncbi:uncharacterized skeletal organic matrix protein 5-like [Pocillopora damicornis]|uniref:uncharacterized skeletal organic matrix protein 5-like n=1 Tax=Pocillopora damicornis TaxID=46731 RepID=UPI000F5578AE|nr:uncharacterized skeletal organic matrix protein 5-like [Pocillopora damicornis]
MKVIAIIFLVHYVIFTDAGKGASKYCKTADAKLDELKEMIENLKCPCPEPPPEPPMSCKYGFEDGAKANKDYMLQVDEFTKLPVYCNMDGAGLGDCGGGGWTLVMKIDGAKSTFKYDSPFWSDKKEYEPSNGRNLDDGETKLPTYWSTSFTKILIAVLECMDSENLMNFSPFSPSQNTVISEASLQQKCNKEGFNVVSDVPNFSKARIGIVGNNENACTTSDSRIGFGTAGYPDDTNSCGNEAKHGGDKGDKSTEAMGYIFVQ